MQKESLLKTKKGKIIVGVSSVTVVLLLVLTLGVFLGWFKSITKQSVEDLNTKWEEMLKDDEKAKPKASELKTYITNKVEPLQDKKIKEKEVSTSTKDKIKTLQQEITDLGKDHELTKTQKSDFKGKLKPILEAIVKDLNLE
ncbi:hypothetical protein [Candidatus Phytoplasma fraxini]|uniref:Immunodominant membrane protein n=1 Tax=Ash yellows phytoplasma TaxID=35780 RepID=A0ABZ2U8F0_ASHYP